MFNPFDSVVEGFFGYEKQYNELERWFENVDRNVRIFGVKGSGKTKLINTIFTRNRKYQALIEKKYICINMTYENLLPKDNPEHSISDLIIKAIKNAIKKLKTDRPDDYEGICELLDDYEDDNYSECLSEIKAMYGYKVILCSDTFNKFIYETSTPKAVDLRTLLDTNALFMLIATNSDIQYNETAIGSQLSEKFNYGIELNGFESMEDTFKLLRAQEEKNNKGEFLISDNEIAIIHKLSGGVPGLSIKMAAMIYKKKVSGGQLFDDERILIKYFLNEPESLVRINLDGWCERVEEGGKHLLYSIAGRECKKSNILTQDFASDVIDYAKLLQRGLICEYENEGEDFVSIISPIFSEYLRNDMWPAGESNTSKVSYEHVPTNVYNYIDNRRINDNRQYIDNRKTMSLNVVGLDHAQLAEIISEYGQKKTSLEKINYLNSTPLIVSDSIPDIEVRNKLQDQFESVRSIRPSITDTILNYMTDEQKYYAMYAVVIEDCLSNLDGMDFGKGTGIIDCSPHLLNYGKLLEQLLRDNLYYLFNRNQFISKLEVRDNAFTGNKNIGKTMIGNYSIILSQHKCVKYLERISRQNYMPKYDADWWTDFGDKVYRSKDLRNLADHASVDKPNQEKLEELCSIMFGNDVVDDNLVSKCFIAGLLQKKYLDYIKKSKSKLGNDNQNDASRFTRDDLMKLLCKYNGEVMLLKNVKLSFNKNGLEGNLENGEPVFVTKKSINKNGYNLEKLINVNIKVKIRDTSPIRPQDPPCFLCDIVSVE